MKLIFLDFDGVLDNLEHIEKYGLSTWRRPFNKNHPDFSSECIQNLNKIIKETNAKTVITSSWRKGKDLISLRGLLYDNGFRGTIIGKTSYDGKRKLSRGEEIEEWLNVNSGLRIEKFIILDDESNMGIHCDKLVKTEYPDTLNEKVIEICIEKLM